MTDSEGDTDADSDAKVSASGTFATTDAGTNESGVNTDTDATTAGESGTGTEATDATGRRESAIEDTTDREGPTAGETAEEFAAALHAGRDLLDPDNPPRSLFVAVTNDSSADFSIGVNSLDDDQGADLAENLATHLNAVASLTGLEPENVAGVALGMARDQRASGNYPRFGNTPTAADGPQRATRASPAPPAESDDDDTNDDADTEQP